MEFSKLVFSLFTLVSVVVPVCRPGSPGNSNNTPGPCFVCCGLTVILNSPGQGEVPPVPPLD